MTWGTFTIGRLSLRETVTTNETGGAARKVSVSGQEASPPLTRAQVLARHDGLLALPEEQVQPCTWTDKPERDGYYLVSSVSAELEDRQGEVVTTGWKLDLERIGTPNAADLQSRLSGTVRANDHALTGERWHAPPPAAYAYYAGSSTPSAGTRTTADGYAITVYRGISAGVSPRWGCPPASYGVGRARVLSDSVETTGSDVLVSASGWELQNGLVRVRLVSGSLEIASYDGTTWDTKAWTVGANSTTITTWDSATVLRNDFECCVLRLTKSRTPGRTTLDLTLRRGSRTVEGYIQNDVSTTLAVYLTGSEATTSGTGYVVATSTDGSGNKYTAGSAKTFSTHANGGVSKAAVTVLDWYAGAVINSASPTAVDAATVLRDHYIGALPESVSGVRR